VRPATLRAPWWSTFANVPSATSGCAWMGRMAVCRRPSTPQGRFSSSPAALVCRPRRHRSFCGVQGATWLARSHCVRDCATRSICPFAVARCCADFLIRDHAGHQHAQGLAGWPALVVRPVPRPPRGGGLGGALWEPRHLVRGRAGRPLDTSPSDQSRLQQQQLHFVDLGSPNGSARRCANRHLYQPAGRGHAHSAWRPRRSKILCPLPPRTAIA